MKTFLITGGTDGIGKGVAMHLLKEGHCVIVVGSSTAKGEKFYNETKEIDVQDRIIFLQADLSLISENKRIVKEIKDRFNKLDGLILCAQYQKYSTTYRETKEGFEFSFGLYYLSRYVLSYSLKSLLEKAETPIIINVCAPGMKGEVRWNDLQYKNKYNSIKAIMHLSRLNDLLGVAFEDVDIRKKIKYMLFNPGAVITNGSTQTYGNPIMKFIIKLTYSLIGKRVNEAIKPIIKLIEDKRINTLSAFQGEKEISLSMEIFNKDNAKRLMKITEELINVK